MMLSSVDSVVEQCIRRILPTQHMFHNVLGLTHLAFIAFLTSFSVYQSRNW